MSRTPAPRRLRINWKNLPTLAATLSVTGCGGPLEWAWDRVFATHTNTAVFRCVERNQDTGLGDYVHRLCREEHSIPVDGTEMALSITCDDNARVTATVQNNSREIIVTGFRLIADGGEDSAIVGEWIPPMSFARYPVPARCQMGALPQVEVAAFRGVRARVRPVFAAGLGDEPTPVFPAQQARERAGEPDRSADAASATTPEETRAAVVQIPRAARPAASADAPPDAPAALPQDTVVGPADSIEAAVEPPPSATAVDERPVVQVDPAELIVGESAAAAYVPIQFTRPVSAPAWINYRLMAKSAQREEDFIGTADERAQIPPGSRTAAILIPIVNDSSPEPDETFSVLVDFTSTNIVLYEPVEILVRIRDDD